MMYPQLSGALAMKRQYGIFTILLAAMLLTSCGGDGLSSGNFPEIDNTQEVQDFYAAHPDLFTFATLDDLPDNLVWENGMELAEIGSPEAKKGGTYYESLEDFPPTLRTTGPDSNSSARSWLSGF